MTKRIVYLDTAADILGLSQEALRKRIKRGSIEAVKDESGRWLITLPDNVQDNSGGRGQAEKDALIRALQQQIDELREDKAFFKTELRQRSEELAWANMKRLQMEGEVKQLEQRVRLLLAPPGAARRWWPFGLNKNK